ncbi:MAG: hypothetical protein IJG64_01395 [Oscillospiraceae bacterium]|nr:hypothetical protein [Oscillospiraceae bacterium]
MNLFFPFALIMALVIFIFWGGRAPHDQRKIFFGWYYADGGVTGPNDKINSVAAFRNCVDNGVGIKVKVVISKDNKPIVAERDDLSKEGYPDVKVSESDSEELARLGVIELSDLFNIVDGKVPVIVEIVSGLHNELLCRRVSDAIKAYGKDNVCVASFHQGIVNWFRGRDPKQFRGIISAPAANFVSLPKYQRFMTGNLMYNNICRPQFYLYRNRPMSLIARFAYGIGPIKGVWTVTDPEEAKKLEEDRGMIVFSGFMPEKPFYKELPDRVKLEDELKREAKAREREEQLKAEQEARLAELRAREAEIKEKGIQPNSHLDEYYGEFHPEEYVEEDEIHSYMKEAEEVSEDLVRSIRADEAELK